MVNELEGVRFSKSPPFRVQEMGQYPVQIVNFRTSKKDPSIADIATVLWLKMFQEKSK
jgi:hypothetical protein